MWFSVSVKCTKLVFSYLGTKTVDQKFRIILNAQTAMEGEVFSSGKKSQNGRERKFVTVKWLLVGTWTYPIVMLLGKIKKHAPSCGTGSNENTNSTTGDLQNSASFQATPPEDGNNYNLSPHD